MGEDLAERLKEGLRRGAYPAAQAALRGPGLAEDAACGQTSLLGASSPVTPETRFDVASLTKALCTSVLLMQAVEQGALALEDRVSRWFPEIPQASRMTVAHLASHRAGLAPHRPFFERIRAEGVVEASAARRRMVALIEAEPLVSAPGQATCYSDLGYLVLGWILEAGLGAPLDVLFAERVAEPLGLSRTSFGPVAGEAVAATEVVEDGLPLRGVVHDENARVIGGVAGHAGLFSTALEVAELVAHLGEVGTGQGGGLVAPETVRRFWRPIPGGSFTLGWDTPTEPSSSGRYTTRGASVGHLGFTGCSVWHDRARLLTLSLLTNRLHPSRENEGIRAFRPEFHDAIWGSFTSRVS